MSVARFHKLSIASLLLTSALPLTAPAQAQTLPEVIQIGADRIGQPCTATRDWSRSKGVIKTAGEQPFSIICRGPSAAKTVAVVAPARLMDINGQRQCGAASNLSISGLGPVSARLCQDPGLGIQVVEVHSGDLVGAASGQAVAPMLRLLRAMADGRANTTLIEWSPTVDLAGLAPAPQTLTGSGQLADFNLDGALQQGIVAIRGGELVTASRILNDALSRVGPTTPSATVAELQLAAALADSGLGQFGPAKKGFAAAEATLRTSRDAERNAYLERALRTYRALDAINQREWNRALAELQAIPPPGNPLNDPIALSSINRDNDRSRATGVSLKDKNQYNWLVLDVQQSHARSIALLGLGRIEESRQALLGRNGAVSSFQLLDQVAQPGSINWLRARVQMQIARIEARANRREAALLAYDCALATMQGRPAPAGGCPIGLSEQASERSFAGESSAIAALQLERAAFASQAGLATADVASQYREAIDTLVASGRSATVQPPALIGYFEFLLNQGKTSPSLAQQEEFFRVMQVVSDPAIASDMVKLESVIASDGSVAEDLRTRVELERQITGLRYRIAALPAGSEAERALLERQRSEAEAEKARIELALNSNDRFRSQDDSPISLAELRQNLREGEVYLKIAKIRTRLYAMTITRDQAWTYAVDAPAAAIENLARKVVDSSRSRLRADGTRRFDVFDVQTSYALFNALSGPAAQAIASAKSVVFDPAGQLRTMPAGVLVVDADSVKRHRASGRKGQFDYSKVNFLASQAEISTAISPRSFTVVRSKVAASTAPRALLGLGEHAIVAAPAADQATRPVISGSGCSVGLGTWINTLNSNRPISARQLGVVAQALGVPGAPTMTGTAFTDVGVQAASESGELSQYQVLHFATHGSPQTSGEIEGCPVDLPPSLVATIAPPPSEGPIVSNGLLSYDKIARLKLNANLVVLAACETSSGAEAVAGRIAGQEDTSQAALDGLVRAFISANARAVIATYWRVPATAQSDELMEKLYSTGRVGTIGEALKTAQTAMIRNPKYSHPYYWGAYFVVGDSAKSMLSGEARTAVNAGSTSGDGTRLSR